MGKVALVTGASGCIGEVIALTFAREGADIVAHYFSHEDKIENIVEEINKIGRKAIAVKADISRENEVNAMIDKAVNTFGRIDILVNNAAYMGMPTKLMECPREEWEKMFAINLLGTLSCMKSVAPYMIKQRYGKIINISTSAALGTAGTHNVAYATIKEGIIHLTKRFAYELGPYNINVNAVAPGMVRTQSTMRALGGSDAEIKEIMDSIAKSKTLRRIAEPIEIANVVLFLASDESSYITGQVIVVDGGGSNYLSHGI